MYSVVDRKIMEQMSKFGIEDLRNNNDDIMDLEVEDVNILCGVNTGENINSCVLQYYMEVLDNEFICVGKSIKIDYVDSKDLVNNIENDVLKNLDRLVIRYMNLTSSNEINEQMFFIGSVIDSRRKYKV